MCTHYLAGCGWFRKCLGFVYTIYSTIVFRDIVRCCDAVASVQNYCGFVLRHIVRICAVLFVCSGHGGPVRISSRSLGGVGLSLQVHEEMESLKRECQKDCTKRGQVSQAAGLGDLSDECRHEAVQPQARSPMASSMRLVRS